MAGRGPQSFKKRQKEQQRKEKQQEKLAKRIERRNQPPTSEEEQFAGLDEDGNPTEIGVRISPTEAPEATPTEA